MQTIRRALVLGAVIVSILLGATISPSARQIAQAADKQSAAGKIDLNTASAEELQTLPGVGEASAKKIIAGRPYRSVDDLSKAGIPAATVQKIKPMVSVKPAPAGGAAKIDLNTASAQELQKLPGIGEASAQKIIAGRPYKSVGDLSKAGISSSTIGKITPLVTVGRPAEGGSAQPPPHKGMVWANPESKIYHKEGDRWYGNTKNGQWMTEADAVKQGYRPSKQSEQK